MILKNKHKWYGILLFLSLENIKMLLKELKFPEEIDFRKFQSIIHETIEELSKSSVRYDEMTEQIVSRIDTKLSRTFDAKDITSILQWSENVYVGTELKKSMQIIWTFILLPLRKSQQELTTIPQEAKDYIKESLVIYQKRQKEILNLVNKVEALPRNALDAQIIEIYNGGEEYSYDTADWITPYDLVYITLKLYQISYWLQDIRNTLSENEFRLLDNYVRQRIREKNAHIKHDSLYKIIEQLHK